MKNKILKYSLLTFLWMVYILPAMAFPGDPESGENQEELEGSPIDNWEWILIMAAICLAIHFIMKNKKKVMV